MAPPWEQVSETGARRWKFQENCSGLRGRAIREQQSPQGLSVTYEAFAVQYLFLFPCMVNYWSQCVVGQQPSCPESRGYLQLYSPVSQ